MLSKQLNFRQIEWWIVTSGNLIAFLVILFGYRPDLYENTDSGIFSFASRLVILFVLDGFFHLVHMVFLPWFLGSEKKWKPVLLLILTGILAFGVSSIFGYQGALIKTPFPTFFLGVVVLYGCYLVGVKLLTEALKPPKFKDFKIYNISRLVFAYLFTLFFLIQLNPIVSEGPAIIFGVFIPTILFAASYNYFLVYGQKKQGNIRQSRFYNWGLVLVLMTIFAIISGNENQEEIFLIGGLGLNAFIQLVFFPLTSLIFKKYDSFQGQISTLSHRVEQGDASFDFLRSQINPHFLFNALNTLYAKALIENAEKTADGIQKLGDMMRFMLHENQLPSIPLSREIDYLRNYLDLQLLRFGAQDNLDLSIQIPDQACQGEIAPMLLIPFVENAFKHGISAKEKSWIRLNLRCLSGSIHLDLVNSVHPDKLFGEESGIGLENVKKRLQLLYPNRHQLTIISNESDYFVHLSLQIQS